jgi:hypothetical protein
MPLNLYRRHCEECKAGRAPDSRTGEFEDRKKGWKRCDCSIFASGTLKGKFKRRSTGVSGWNEAKTIIADWKSWDDELPVSIPPPTTEPTITAKVTIDKAIKDFLDDHEGESADSTVRGYRYLLEDFKRVSALSGFVALEQWGPAEIRQYRKSWNVAAKTAAKKNVAANTAAKKNVAAKKSIAANTAAKKMAILKAFFEFCLTNEWIRLASFDRSTIATRMRKRSAFPSPTMS